MKQLLSSIKPHTIQQKLLFCFFLIGLSGVLGYIIGHTAEYIKYMCIIYMFLLTLCAKKTIPLDGFARFLFILLIFDTIFITIDTFSTHIGYFNSSDGTFLSKITVSPLFVPHLFPILILIIDKDEIDVRYIIALASVFLVCYFCFYPYSFYSMTHWTWEETANTEWGEKGSYGDFITNSTLGIASIAVPTICIFLRQYTARKKWIMYLATYIGTLLMALFLARRGRTVMILLHLLSCWGLYSFMNDKTSKTRMIFILLAAVGLCYAMASSTADTFLANIIGRGLEDTREEVEISFWLDMFNSNDIWTGRGWFGQYYDTFYGYRSTIETGYMALILRGGIIYLILYVLMFLYAGIRGLFFSNNILAKSFAVLIILSIVELYPYGWPAINLNYFILWIGIIFCCNSNLRSLTDNEIYFKYFA